MRRSAIVLLALLLALPSYAQETKSSLTTEITTQFPDQNAGTITPAKLRQVTTDMVNSWQQFASVNSQSGTTYTFLTSDYGRFVTFNNVSNIAATLPQATGLFSTYNVYASNVGSSSVTITPVISKINGSSSYTLAAGNSVWIISDGTNYQIFTGSGGGGGGGGGVSQVNTGTGLSGGPITGTGTISCVLATILAPGCVQPDGTTITVVGGVITAVIGTISGPGTTVSGYATLWNNTTGTLLGAGLPVATTTTSSAIVETNSGGTIDNSFLPAFTGAITISLGVTSYNQVVPSTEGGAGSISGALKANGSGTVTQAAASDLSNGVTGSGAVVLAVSPTFTGVPLSPTATLGTNTTQLATTAFVQAAVGAGGNSTPLDQVFYTSSDFTPGSTTTLTLCTGSAVPAACTTPSVTAMLQVYFDGVAQSGNTWTYGTGVVTFLAAIPSNVQTVEAHWFAPAIGAGVSSLGGMTGVITCGTGLSCSANNIVVTSGGLPTLANGNIWIGSVSNAAVQNVLSGAATMSNTGVVTLAAVNSNVGTFGAASMVPSFAVNAKGLITAVSGIAVIAPASTLSGPILNGTVVNSSLATVGNLIGGSTGSGFTINLAASTIVGSLPVASGGTGGTTYTANKPLIGNGTSAVTSGTTSGTTTEFGTINSALVSGNCIKSDGSGNLVDAGSACGGGGGVAWYNVLSYSSNLSTALAACTSAGGGLVYIPAHTTVAVLSSNSVTTNCGIIGDGPSSIIQQYTSSSVTLTIPASANSVYLSNFRIAYASQGTSGGIAIDNFSNNGEYPSYFGDIQIYKANFGIVHENGANLANYERIKAIDNTVLGFEVNGYPAQSVGATFRDCDAIDDVGNTYFTAAGFYLYGQAQGNQFINNSVFGVKGANLILTSDGSTGPAHSPTENQFTGNFFDESFSLGGIYWGYNNVFTNNWISGYGFSVQEGVNNIFIGNQFFNTSHTPLTIYATATQTVISGNYFGNNTGGTALLVSANTTDFSITNNSFANVAVAGQSNGPTTSTIVVASGTSNRYIITGNLVGSIAAVSDGGSGSSKTVSGNW